LGHKTRDDEMYIIECQRTCEVLIYKSQEYLNNEYKYLKSTVPSRRDTTFFSCYLTNVLLLCKYLLDNTPHPQISDRKNNKYATFLKEQTILIVRRQYPLKT